MAQSGSGATRRLHSGQAFEPERGDGLVFGDRREDRAERHVVGIDREPPFELGLVAGRDAESEALPAYGGEIRRVEVLLPEVDPLRALVDRRAPVVVDDQRRAGLAADGERVAGFPREDRPVGVLDPELDQLRADPDQTADPGGAVDDGVEGVEGHERSPSTL